MFPEGLGDRLSFIGASEVESCLRKVVASKLTEANLMGASWYGSSQHPGVGAGFSRGGVIKAFRSFLGFGYSCIQIFRKGEPLCQTSP